MDVAGSLFDSFGENEIHELDDWRFFDRLSEVADVQIAVLLFLYDLHARIFDAGHDVLERLGGIVEAIDRPSDPPLGPPHRLDLQAGHKLDVVYGEDIGGVGHGHGQRRPSLANGNHQMLLDDAWRDQADHLQRDRLAVQVDVGDAVLFAQALTNLLLLDPAEFCQDGA